MTPIAVTETITGSAGNWTYDFSFTNNLGGFNDIYFLGVQTSATDTVGSPSGWGIDAGDIPWIYTQSAISYNNTWCADACEGQYAQAIAPGSTLGGFKVHDTSLVAETNTPWFAYAFGGVYDGVGYFGDDTNPGFEGLVTSAVPEPGTWAMVLLGFAGLGFVANRRAKFKRDAVLSVG